ncbi:cupin-like domain-containing protein [Usitatibacter palustris]|uniref:JmjC domain-containing protein n=1 Tax=Usitatibacter palustris TaxID=2732487 RepID=A0A6M4HB15_9PROT|nr:cupin-like domain-containing protein [Usitatibacter palustris]QJR16776.1 hypothetical protein DSM104440_03612 [Usitatibacter palustris]
MTPMREWQGVDAETFRTQVVPLYQPAVLRGLVSNWPAVARGRESPEAIASYLQGFDSGAPVDVLTMPPHVRGRIFYTEDMSGFTYTRDRVAVSKVATQLVRYAKFDNRPGIAAQSALISECLPRFKEENVLPLLDATVEPRIWLGSAVTTPAHLDESNNIACVVTGRRRFTLFPPEQAANLYIGPLDYAPTGTPISLVDFKHPDFDRYPKFRDALAAAHVADLEPGDAIYIPTLWWHHVESLEKVNMLVNYWWKGHVGSAAQGGSALDVLLLALLNLRHLPPEHRAAWRAIFDHYIFSATEDVSSHIPAHRHGVLGPISPEFAKEVREFLVKQLRK